MSRLQTFLSNLPRPIVSRRDFAATLVPRPTLSLTPMERFYATLRKRCDDSIRRTIWATPSTGDFPLGMPVDKDHAVRRIPIPSDGSPGHRFLDRRQIRRG